MAINAVSGAVSGVGGISASQSTAQTSGSGFSNILTDAINDIEQTETEANEANEALLTGESDDLHTAIIAAQKAEIAVSYAVQIRNRVLESYNTVMNMQV